MDIENARLDRILHEMQEEHKHGIAFGDALDAKLTTLIGNGGLILTIFTGLGALRTPSTVYWIALGVTTAIYFASLVYMAVRLKPVNYSFPLVAEWDFLKEKYFTIEDGTFFLKKLIRQYVMAIDDNKAQIERKAKAVDVGMVIFAVCVSVLIFLQILTM